MAFQKRALSPEEMRGLAGGWFDTEPSPVDMILEDSDDMLDHHLVAYFVYDNSTNEPIAAYNSLEAAQEADAHYHKTGEILCRWSKVNSERVAEWSQFVENELMRSEAGYTYWPTTRHIKKIV